MPLRLGVVNVRNLLACPVVYYNGDLYSVPAFPSTEATGGQVPVFAVDEQFTASALHGDNTFRPTFFDKQMTLRMGAPSSGIANHGQVVKLEDKISELIGVATQIQAAVSNMKMAIDRELSGKANRRHTHDDRYYTETEVDTKLAGKAASSHTHDELYYTETEMNTMLAGKLNKSGGLPLVLRAVLKGVGGNNVQYYSLEYLDQDNTWKKVINNVVMAYSGVYISVRVC